MEGGPTLFCAPLHSEVAKETTVEFVVLYPFPIDKLAASEGVIHHELHIGPFKVELPSLERRADRYQNGQTPHHV